ncbi:hypothetical protein Agub_g6929, partial [Astrephomene gubernaculifera]
MFGLGRRKDNEIRRLQAEVEQAQLSLQEANKRAENAESQAALLASQNRALAAKVHRLALQRVELENDKVRVERENKDLQLANLRLETEKQAAKGAETDAWQVTNLKIALAQQAAQHRTKLASLKRRTKALLNAVLPGGNGRGARAGLGQLSPAPCDKTYSRSAPGSPTTEHALADLWDTPLNPPSMLDAETDLHTRVRQVIGWLYDDTISEDQALEQITSLTQNLMIQPQSPPAMSRGCSPFPVPKLATTTTGDGSAEKVDAATDVQTSRPRHFSDVATETPEELSHIGTPRESGTPQRLMPPGVRPLDLAALVAQAMETAPLSGRSTASTTAASSAAAPSSFNAFSQFVLAQPEKLQRLIMRHAAATGAKTGSAQPQQSPFGGHMLSFTSGSHNAVATATTTAGGLADNYVPGLSSNLEPPSMASTGAATSRPNLTSRLLGLSSAANVNRATAPAVPPASSPVAAGPNTAAAGVVLPSSGPITSPAKRPAKRSAAMPPPKIAH